MSRGGNFHIRGIVTIQACLVGRMSGNRTGGQPLAVLLESVSIHPDRTLYMTAGTYLYTGAGLLAGHLFNQPHVNFPFVSVGAIDDIGFTVVAHGFHVSIALLDIVTYLSHGIEQQRRSMIGDHARIIGHQNRLNQGHRGHPHQLQGRAVGKCSVLYTHVGGLIRQGDLCQSHTISESE